jgi:hypothetical protein
MSWRAVIGTLALALLFALPLVAQKAKRGELVIPDQVVELPDPENAFAAAERPCANYGWAAAMQTLLAGSGLQLTQEQWVTRVSGGAKCLLSVDDFAALTQSAEGEYVLGNGRRVRLRTLLQGGAPTIVDSLIVRLRAGRTYMVMWDDRLYLLAGILYDDRMRSYYSHVYVVKELRLVDPLIAPGRPGRTVTLRREKDKLDKIRGLISLELIELRPGQLSDGFPQ